MTQRFFQQNILYVTLSYNSIICNWVYLKRSHRKLSLKDCKNKELNAKCVNLISTNKEVLNDTKKFQYIDFKVTVHDNLIICI